MPNLSEISISELKSIYDFLELRKGIISNNLDSFDKSDIHKIINKQKVIYLELINRIDRIDELNI